MEEPRKRTTFAALLVDYLSNQKDMKHFLLVVISLFVSQLMTAGNVTEQEALRKAQQFLQGRSFQQKDLRRSATANTFAQGAFYVFNADGNQGFVIVSADDRTESILGYSDTGRLDLNNLPANAAAWLQGYARQIKSLGEGVSLSAPHRAPGTEKVELTTAKWNQDAPYNGMCPKDSKGQCYTGCTAIAMAIVMQYFKWPKDMKALPAYTSPKKDGDADIPMEALPTTTFDWENHLKLTYTKKDGVKNYSDADSAEVAKLMRYCGQSIKMQYGSSASSGSAHVKDFVETFGYSKTANEANRYGFSNEEWEKMIYDEIVAKRVVFYSGFNESAGHSFVIDGYDGNGLFHLNWGWGGSDDGYFTLATLNPDAKSIDGLRTGNGYPMQDVAIIGLKQPEGSDVASEPYIYNMTYIGEGNPNVYTRANTTANFADVKMVTSFCYSGITAPKIKYTLKAYKDGTLYKDLGVEGEMELSTENKDGKVTVSFGADWPNGTYELRPFYQLQGKTAWKEPCLDDQGWKLYALIEGTKLTLSTSDPYKYGNIKMSFVGDYVVHRPMEAKVTWTRPQENENNENRFYLWLEGSKSAVGATSSFVAKGVTETLTIAFKSTKVGEFSYYITSDEKGEDKVYTSTSKIKFREIGKQRLDLSSWTEENIKTGEKEGELPVLTFRPKLTIKNKGTNAYDDNIVCQLIPIDAEGTAQGEPMIKTVKINLEAGAQSETPAQEFPGLKNNQRYKFLVYFYSNEEFPGYGMYYYYPYPLLEYIFTVKDPTGINAVKADEKTDAPLYNLNGQRVGDNYKGIVIKNGKKYVVK